jgi:hypothetical protein
MGRREKRSVKTTQAFAAEAGKSLWRGQLDSLKFFWVSGLLWVRPGKSLTRFGQQAIRGGCGFCDRRGQLERIRMGALAFGRAREALRPYGLFVSPGCVLEIFSSL